MSRRAALYFLLTVAILVWQQSPAANGQIFPGPTNLPAADLQLLDSAGAAHLENARQLLAQRQWDEAVEAIRRVLENDGGRLIRADVPALQGSPSFAWYVPVRDYCHWRLAALAWEAPEALAAYRRLVDPLAERWLSDGKQQHQPALFRRVIDEAWASRSGDDAALALGDDAFSSGNLVLARYWWERTGLGFVTSDGKPLWVFAEPRSSAVDLIKLLAPSRAIGPNYPDSDLPAAEIRARSIIAAILQGESERAQLELRWFRLLHAADEGTIAGRHGNYVELLTAFSEQAKTWPALHQPSITTTWGGTPLRNGVVVSPPDPAGQALWSVNLPRLTSDRDIIGAGRLRVADDMKALAAYYPVIWKNDVLLRADARGDSYLAAYDLTSGKQRWRIGYQRQASRTVEPPADDGSLGEINDVHTDLPRHVGVARFTLTVDGDRAFARLGSAVTSPRARRLERLLAKDQGWLIGVDLAAEGKPLNGFPIRPESAEWSFEGAPIIHDGALYVAMRHVEGSRSQVHIACYELATTAVPTNDDDDDSRPIGRLRFRTRIASSATLGGGNLDEVSQLLLTAAHGQIYCNTNAGAVGAVDAASGRLKWVVTYPRATFDDESSGGSSFFRDLNPCLAADDLVIVAPQDCEFLFALDAVSGRLRWRTFEGAAADANCLLGVRSGRLIAAGDRVYWFDTRNGKQLAQYPAGRAQGPLTASASPRGLGQGVLAGNQIWWPTRESILILPTEPAVTPSNFSPALLREIPLVPRGVQGGNLLIVGDRLLISTGTQLTAFGPQPPGTPQPQLEAR
ncbi:Outer membrane protein assembly factor BamB [Anatilimnocola aggregata]|uniref:Outer membrane protein assembly factor BamB n=1 Tax=Anatilimnocola aggregata TaxID=2528021 RepID=A0A517YN48_9BACT|nr:PQQ-binding-like beta-propeller repeat protein [Anatilimnocola aggregata]QDU31643.1 Outer membrane protein assembly factor BamB [Anatilimnocola aggregata]